MHAHGCQLLEYEPFSVAFIFKAAFEHGFVLLDAHGSFEDRAGPCLIAPSLPPVVRTWVNAQNKWDLRCRLRVSMSIFFPLSF